MTRYRIREEIEEGKSTFYPEYKDGIFGGWTRIVKYHIQKRKEYYYDYYKHALKEVERHKKNELKREEVKKTRLTKIYNL